MPVDMSPEAITRRLRIAGELMRTCLELRKARPAEAAPSELAPEPGDSGPAQAADNRRTPKA